MLADPAGSGPPRPNTRARLDRTNRMRDGSRRCIGPPCASIVIASSGPEKPDRHQTLFGEIRSRNGACLKYTRRDAESVYALWRKEDFGLPDELQLLLEDPTIGEVERTLRAVSTRIREAYPDDIGLDLFFAGHGEEGTGNLVLKDGTLSPTRLLQLQADDVDPDNVGRGQRTIGVWLDSCYSGAFLLRVAIESFEHEAFRLDEGLASCLPNESCYEMDILEHGVFTYTRRHPGNAHVNRERFNRAILHNDQTHFAEVVLTRGSVIQLDIDGSTSAGRLDMNGATIARDVYLTAEFKEVTLRGARIRLRAGWVGSPARCQ